MANEAGNEEGKDKPGDGNPGEGKPAAGAGGGEAGGEKTYSQADLDAALAADRLASKRAAAARANKPAAKGKSKDGEADDDGAHEAALAAERKRAEDAESQLRVRDARDAVEAAAKNAGFGNPSKIYRLLKDDLSFDDAGKPDNVKDLITIAKKDFPEELTSGKANGSADGGAVGGVRITSGGRMNALIRSAAGLSN